LTPGTTESKLKKDQYKENSMVSVASLAMQDTMISSLITRLTDRLGSDLSELWLFGSRARGDNSDDADWDLLVVAQGDERRNRSILLEASHAMMDEYYELVGILDYSPPMWEKALHSPLGQNIKREGIRLL